MSERRIEDLATFLQGQISAGAKGAGEKLVAASQLLDYSQAVSEIDEGRKILKGITPIRRVINAISERIDRIREELEKSGATLPDGFELRLSLLYDEQPVEEPVEVEEPTLEEEKAPESETEAIAAIHAFLGELPPNLLFTSLEIKPDTQGMESWQVHDDRVRELRMRYKTVEEVNTSTSRVLISLFTHDLKRDLGEVWEIIKHKLDVFRRCQQGLAEEKELGFWEFAPEKVTIEEGCFGSGLELTRKQYNQGIEDLSLSVRTYNALLINNFTNIGAILSMPEDYLKSRDMRKFGQKSFAELKNALTEKGFLPAEQQHQE